MKDSQGCSEEATPVSGKATHNDKENSKKECPAGPADNSRRSSLGNLGGATAAALAAGIPLEPLFEVSRAGRRFRSYCAPERRLSGGRSFGSTRPRCPTCLVLIYSKVQRLDT